MKATTLKMKTNSNSSGGSSNASSSVDLKTNEKRNYDMQQPKPARSRSFLHCLGNHLGRHFSQQHHHRFAYQHQYSEHSACQQQLEREPGHEILTVYNSEEDIHSSSTDSFSLSYDRCYTHTASSCPMTAGSSIDLSNEERSSGASSAASAYSRLSSTVFNNAEADSIWAKQQQQPKQQQQHEQQRQRQKPQQQQLQQNARHQHFFVETTYRRPTSALGQRGIDELSISSSRDDVDNDNESDDADDNDDHQQQQAAKVNRDDNNDNAIRLAAAKKKSSAPNLTNESNNDNDTPPTSRSRSISPCSITKGLHLSRISITSSMCRMFQQFNISSSNATSTRSLSCSSTPLRGIINVSGNNKKRTTSTKKSSKAAAATSTTSTSSSSPTHCTTNSTAPKSCVKFTNSSSSKKVEKKQQSILRPPVHYVYMKGMSGLYSRVPRYTVCSPYAMQQTM